MSHSNNQPYSMSVSSVDVTPIKIIFGLLTVFAYSLTIISFLSIFLTLYPFLEFFCNKTFAFFPYRICTFANYFAYVVCKITFLPCYISAAFRNTFSLFKNDFSEKAKNILFFAFVLCILLIISGTVEINPGPHPSKKNFSFAFWNLDSLPARDFARIPLIETLQSTYDFDMFGVCESMLTANIPNEDIFINGFSPDPFRSDKDSDTRNGGVCLYFKESLPIKERCDLELIPETIVAEIKFHRKKIFFVLSYC